MRGLGVLVVATLLSAAVACSSQPAPSSAPAAPDRYGAPTVPRSLRVLDVAATPCTSLLTAAELSSLGFERQGRQRTNLDVQECAWTASSGEGMSMAVDVDRDLLADVYRTGRRGFFQATEVEGLPAVRQKSGTGELNNCVVTTGLGPRQALTTDWFGKEPSRPATDACMLAERVSAMVIRKLPPAR